MPRRPSKKDATPGGPEGLDWALPPVRSWFVETFGTPTAAQRGGWPSIAAGRHTLICAPTGTGKTLAAFLACLDAAWRLDDPPAGTRVLYVSPLKALNRDIAANLEAPLDGIISTAERLGSPLRPLTVGVRTGDTPAAERRAQGKRPPDLLITTPESLHLLLSSRARETLRGVSHVIIDEIHDLCTSKRGASLALLLERLGRLCPSGFVRIGLSATMNPLEDVARFLGGWQGHEPRPVTIVDAGVSKQIEVRVAPAFPSSGPSEEAGGGLASQLLGLIRSHQSTLIFANNRAEVERLTVRLNRLAAGDAPRPEGHEEAREVVRSHHGSLSLEQRRATEEALKRGELAAVVATSSLELGIDVGSIDLVCQVGSPGGVARGLQRVGRAGHSAGAVSRARFFARGEGELIELAALADAMHAGAVEPVRIPRNCLDVLAQQVIACVADGPWDAPSLLDLARQADPFHTLPAGHFEAVVAMLSGRSDVVDVRDLRPRIRWDRVANRLEPLPGTQRLALLGGNTIPDSGQFPVVLEGGPRLGEFDEDFVMERRAGDTVLLGTSTWVIRSIDGRRVVVAPAEGRSAVLPYWRGEGLGRSSALGGRVGALRRLIADRIEDPSLPSELAGRFAVEPEAAAILVGAVARQIRAAGAVPDDRTVLVEPFVDRAGVANVAILSPFGSRFHLALKLVLQGAIRRRLGSSIACHHGDDGVLLPFPGTDAPPTDLLDGLSPDDCDALLIVELRDSALFGLRFRQVANRALLVGRSGPAGRVPLWFQRLRAEELLGRLGGLSDHPLIVETYRECLNDDLDLPGLRAFLGAIRDGSIAVRVAMGEESPSPFAAALARSFNDRFADRFERRSRRARSRSGGAKPGGATRHEPPDPALIAAWIDPDAVRRVESRLRGVAHPPRVAAEMAELLRFCGDLSPGELSGPMASFLEELAGRGVVDRVRIDGAEEPERWVCVESLPDYAAAFGIDHRTAGNGDAPSQEAAIDRVVRAFLRSRALVGAEEVASRYGIGVPRARRILGRFVASGDVVSLRGEAVDGPERWGDRRNVEDVRRIAVALKRKEAVAVEPEVFADLLARHQHAHPGSTLRGREGVATVLRQLRGFAPVAELWEFDLLPRRVEDFAPARLDEVLRTEGWIWRREAAVEPARLTLVPVDFGGAWPERDERPPLSPEAASLLDVLKSSGLVEADELAACSGLDAMALGRALAELSGLGFIGGDHFDPIRGARLDPKVAAVASRSRRAAGRPASGRRRREGPLWDASGVRWAALSGADGSEEGPAGGVLVWARAMLDRFGVLCRETAGLDPWAPPWSALRGELDASELRGEVRRGYFVAGFSGVQFALEAFADQLARHRPGEDEPRAVLLSTLDPANLYGSGGPFELPSPDRGGARLVRSASNHLAMVRGRPVLLSEGFGRSLTVFPWATEAEAALALATISGLAGPSRRILKVQRIDGRPALESRHAARLIEAGFVRNPPGLAFYAGWSPRPST